MKRYGNLFESVIEFENLRLAHKKALSGSGKNEEACDFTFHLEEELFALKEDLLNEKYRPGRYRYFSIHEPKERTISVAPFRDRVVHHAVVRVLEEIFERTFIYDSYTTRKGKGTHRAVKRAQLFLRDDVFYLKFDINKYFDSIIHETLIKIIGRKIKDRKFMRLLWVIITNSDISRGEQTGRGIPIGNLTSQFFANVYLDVFDHYVKEILGAKRYIRYMDDCVIFHNDKKRLKEIRRNVEQFLHQKLGLDLKKSATFINTRYNGLPFLGYRVFPSLIRIKRENVKRLKRKILKREMQFMCGIIDEDRYRMSLASLIGYAESADTLQLRKHLFKNKG